MTASPSKSLVAVYRVISPVFDPRVAWRGIVGYPRYFMELWRYRRMARQAGRDVRYEFHPVLHDRTSTTGFDPHYTHLSYWATSKIMRSQDIHVDVASSIAWVMAAAAYRPITFLDIRPFETAVPGLTVKAGTVLEMPYDDRSVASLSCLHVAEHVGLGRYGDPLDPAGTDLAIEELSRVLAPGGSLYFALPIGRGRVCFNAHRISDPRDIIHKFESQGLTLKEFSAVGDDRRLYLQAQPDAFAEADYACGFFEFARAPLSSKS